MWAGYWYNIINVCRGKSGLQRVFLGDRDATVSGFSVNVPITTDLPIESSTSRSQSGNTSGAQITRTPVFP